MGVKAEGIGKVMVMAKVRKSCSILELPLRTEKWQADKINTQMECARKIYNSMLAYYKNNYDQMTRTRAWRNNMAVIRDELQRGQELADKGKKKVVTSALQSAYDMKNQMMRSYGFSDFDMQAKAIDFSQFYRKNISTSIAQLSIGVPMWKSFEELFFGNGEQVHFKKMGDCPSLVSNNKSGIRFLQMDDGKYYVVISNRKAHAKTLTIPVMGPSTAWEVQMLHGSSIKQTRIVRRYEKSKTAFYVQLCVDKAPVTKRDLEGNEKHTVGSGVVGIQIWNSELYAVSDNEIFHVNLLAGSDEFEKRRSELTKELTYLRQVNNPDNFEEDGQIKRGIIDENGKRQKLNWRYSNHYYQVKNELRELYRVNDERKKIMRNRVVWQLLSMGDHFVFADCSFRNDKPEWDEENPLPQGEYRKKKKKRKSIQEGAPAALLTRLDAKLTDFQLEKVQRYIIPDELYWYSHERGVSDQSLFQPGADIVVCGKVIKQTLYRAFLIRHFAETTHNDQKALTEEWEHFLSLIK